MKTLRIPPRATTAPDDLARHLEPPPAAVFVDCFGTLLHRRIPAWRVERLVADELALALRGAVDGATLAAAWRRRARELGRSPGPSGAHPPRDVHLREVAAALHAELLRGDLDQQAFVELLVETLVAAEIRATRPNAELVALLRGLPAGVHRAVVSDTGLAEDQLRAILRAHGIEELFDAVVVSSDQGRTKRSGELYEVALEAVDAPAASVLMIGDRPTSDVDQARRHGIASLLVDGGRWDGAKDAGERALRRDLERRIDEVLHADRDAVMPELSLTLWLFTFRLDRALRRSGAPRAVFLAREGRFLRALYERYDQARAHSARPPLPTSYLLTSRKSTTDLDGEQQELLREVLDAAAPEPGTLHVVDVGWKGTVADRLAELTGRDVEAHLLGLVGADPVGAARKHGHLFRNRPDRSAYYQVFSHFKALYEHLLAADHGSVARYRRAADGSVEADLDDHPEERRCYAALAGPFQEATLARFDELVRVLDLVGDEPGWLTEVVARRHARLVYRPTRRELDLVEGLVQFENFGEEAVKRAGVVESGQATGRGFRRHVQGGGWPPLRMRHAGVGWQRHPYAAVKYVQLRTGRLR